MRVDISSMQDRQHGLVSELQARHSAELDVELTKLMVVERQVDHLVELVQELRYFCSGFVTGDSSTARESTSCRERSRARSGSASA